MNGAALRTLVRSVLAILVATSTVACGVGDDGGDGGDRAAPSAATGPAVLLAPEAFAARIARPEAVVINVHVPYEGEIVGTDASIPFDEIGGDERLPAARDAEIVLYCRSGRMSQTAAETLAAAGYTNLVDLEGGMLAWEAAGRPLLHRNGHEAPPAAAGPRGVQLTGI